LLYPNPANRYLHISGEYNASQVKIYSINGEMVLEKVLSEPGIDISGLETGVYILVLDETRSLRFFKK
jgi:hypothetical protein